MLNNLITHCLERNRNRNVRKKFVKSFSKIYVIVEIKLVLHYEPENLDVNKVCFAKATGYL